MVLFADLHLHSKHSRAVSQSMDLEHLLQGAEKKGLGLLGTGDFTHPLWFAELERKLEPAENENAGVYQLKDFSSPVRFVLQTEVSTIYSDKGKVKKIHHLLFAPSLDIVKQLNDVLAKRGNLLADGRPTFGNTTCAELVELCKQLNPQIEVVPAHAWTPWFSVFGSNSGFDSIEEAYGDQSTHVRAFETGMSSSPAMNWRVSALDKYAQLSNSDSHSPYPYRIGRECNAFDFDLQSLSYSALFRAINSKDPRRFLFTVEVDPNYGKYHYDGHRNCKFSCPPEESRRLQNRCPVCKRPLTIGVLNRVEQLADRSPGFVPKGAIPFKTLLPLQELVAAVYPSTLLSKKVVQETEKLVSAFQAELEVLLSIPFDDLTKVTNAKLARVILLNREGQLHVKPGFDGEYGILQLKGSETTASTQKPRDEKQKGLEEFS